MKTRVYEVTLVVVDHDKVGTQGIMETLQNANYPNDCIRPHVVNMRFEEVEWTDDHPLNIKDKFLQAYRALFGRKT